MKGLKTLVLMQLRDKVDFSWISSVKKTIFKVVLSVLKFAIITALIYLGFFVLSLLRIVSLLPGIPHKVLTLLFTFMMILSIIVCTFGLMKSLYFSKDNPMLLTLPVQRTTVFTSKILVYYFYEILKNIYFLLPLFIAYGLTNGISLLFYLYLPIIMIIVSAIPVVLGALLSIPLMFLVNFVKQHKWLEYILVALSIASVVLLLLTLIAAIPQNIDLIGTWGTTFWSFQAFLNNFVKVFAPFEWITIAIVGTRYGIVNNLFILNQFFYTAMIILGIFAVLLFTYLLVRPLFFKIASSPFEYRKKRIVKLHNNKKRPSFSSSVRKEISTIYNSPAKFYSLISVTAGLPIAIFLLNKIYAAMDTRLSGAYMSIAFNILIILLLALSSSISLSYALSEEGNSAYLMKTTPTPFLQSIIAKLTTNFTLMTFSLIATTAIFSHYMLFDFGKSILIFLLLESIYVSHLLWSIEGDIMNPQNAQYQTTGTHLSNPNEVKSSISVFLLAAMFAFLTFFFLPEGRDIVWLRLLVFSTLFLAFRIYMFVNKVNIYYKEKG